MSEPKELFEFLEGVIQQEYEICRELKKNDRGTVQLVRNKNSGNLYILKRFLGDGGAYRLLKSCQSSWLCGIYEVAQKEGEVLVLEEYIQGDTLQFLMENGPLTVPQTRTIAEDLCKALWILHSRGLVHRDVKPENVILRGNHAVLVDFDACREKKADQETDTRVLGTIGYAAPEQFGISQTDARTDIYALGVLINMMLTGAHPSSRMPRGKWGFIVKRCTMMNSRQRFKDVRQLLNLL